MTRISKKDKFSEEMISFEPVDFLKEGIAEFIESGSNPRKLASCIVKIAIALELILKDELEKICPALILDKIDNAGLQLVKIYNLQGKFINPDELENIEIKTAPFPILLERAGKFLDIKSVKSHLMRLHRIRSSLIHHKADIDIWSINILLIKRILPFTQKLLKKDKYNKIKISKNTWDRLKNIEKESINVFQSELSKKITYHNILANTFPKIKIDSLLKSQVEIEDKTEVIEKDNLVCPACKNHSSALLIGLDVDWNPDGVLENAYRVMRCRVCELKLNYDEIEYICSHLDHFFTKTKSIEEWQSAIEPDIYDYK